MKFSLYLFVAACTVSPSESFSTDRCTISAFVKNFELVTTARYQCLVPRVITAYLNGYAELSDDTIFQFGTHVQLIPCDGSALTITYPLPRGLLPSTARTSAGFDQGQVECATAPEIVQSR